uniref:Uncharacterized protein n=1 Tax=Heterorhabditis bacteriophora TaxID=37862 RepID=A0A1I7XN87_HETBA
MLWWWNLSYNLSHAMSIGREVNTKRDHVCSALVVSDV